MGFLQSVPSPAVTELAATSGYDFLILDSEHGLFSELDHFQALLTLSGSDVPALVRLRGHDAQALGRYLDMGADGILIPNVTSAEEAQLMVRAASYPPAGARGFAGALARAARYGADLAAHVRTPRGGIFIAVMIEAMGGVENIDAILDVEGVDGVVIGPFDLTADMGFPGDFSRSGYAEALMHIERSAAARGKVYGTAPHPGYSLRELIARGHRLITLAADMSLFREAMSVQLAQALSAS